MHLAHRYDINRSGGMSVMANTFENYLGSSVKMTHLLRGLCGQMLTQSNSKEKTFPAPSWLLLAGTTQRCIRTTSGISMNYLQHFNQNARRERW